MPVEDDLAVNDGSHRAIERLEVSGFRSLRSVALEKLGRIVVLIGPNGSGKSNLLTFLRLVPLLGTRSLQRFVAESGGASALLHYGSNVTREITFELGFVQGEHRNGYRARLGVSAGDTLIFLDEEVGQGRITSSELRWQSLGAGHRESMLDEAAQEPQAHAARTVRWWLGQMNFFHFHDTSVDSALRSNSSDVDTRYLRSDGRNIAAYLAALRDSDARSRQVAWRRINGLVRRIAPCIKELSPSPVGEHHWRLDWIDDRDEVFGSYQLSDGTLRAIALVTALAQPVEQLPAFITIDEPELGLHPAALALIAELVKSITAHSQVVLATQSTQLLDHFEPEHVVVTERHDGATSLRRLDEPTLQSWLEDYSLSELFEKNVLGGRP